MNASAGQPEGTVRILVIAESQRGELLLARRSSVDSLSQLQCCAMVADKSDSIRSDGESSCVLPERSATGTAGGVSAHVAQPLDRRRLGEQRERGGGVCKPMSLPPA